MEGKILQFNQLRTLTESIVNIVDYVQLNHMKTINSMENNKFDTIVYIILFWVLGFLIGYFKGKNK